MCETRVCKINRSTSRLEPRDRYSPQFQKSHQRLIMSTLTFLRDPGPFNLSLMLRGRIPLRFTSAPRARPADVSADTLPPPSVHPHCGSSARSVTRQRARARSPVPVNNEKFASGASTFRERDSSFGHGDIGGPVDTSLRRTSTSSSSPLPPPRSSSCRRCFRRSTRIHTDEATTESASRECRHHVEHQINLLACLPIHPPARLLVDYSVNFAQ